MTQALSGTLTRPLAGRPWLLAGGLLLAPAALMLLSLLSGAGDWTMGQALAGLLGHPIPEDLQLVMSQLRWPRTLGAWLIGALLGLAATLLQTATRNPLAETGLLGINGGAALGVVLGLFCGQIVLPLDYFPWAMAGALLGNGCILLLLRRAGPRASPLRLILAGAALSATFQGLTAVLLLFDQNAYDQYRFWVLGSLVGIRWPMVAWLAGFSLVGGLLAWALARPLSALQLGQGSARALGYRPGLIRLLVSALVAWLAGSAVAVAGPLLLIGLLGALCAHALLGPRLLPRLALSAWFGGLLLLAADIAARLLLRPYDLPVSLLLALLGAPVLIALVWRARLHW